MTSCGSPSLRIWPGTRACPGPVPVPHRVRRSGVPALVHRPGSRSARCAAGRCRTVRALAAGGPPVQAVDRVAASVGADPLLPHLHHRRHYRSFTRRVRAPAPGCRRVAHPGPVAPAVRGDARRGQNVNQPVRLRPRSQSSARWGCGSSKPALRTPTISVRNTATACYPWSARAPRSSRCHLPWAVRSTERSAIVMTGRSCSTAPAPGWTATPRCVGSAVA
jgi:hypothetical protein